MGEHFFHLAFAFLPLFTWLVIRFFQPQSFHLTTRGIFGLIACLVIVLHLGFGLHIAHTIGSNDHTIHQCCVVPVAVAVDDSIVSYLAENSRVVYEEPVTGFHSAYLTLDLNKSPPLG